MKNIRFSIFLVITLLLIILSFGVEFHYMGLKSVPFLTKIVLLLLLNLTIIALITLMFFVSKSLVRLYIDRRNRVLGYKFKTKFVVILVVFTSIPAASLFFVSSGLITNYIERWFAPELRQPLDRSIEIAKSIYEIERQKALDYAEALSAGKTTGGNYNVKHLTEMPKDATETMRSAFEGKADVEVISGEKEDTVRAVAPEYKEGKQIGIIVVESLIPAKITENVENIKEAYENYLTLESWKVPIKINYLLILGFFTMIVVLMALWIALRISRGITDPIQNLAQATERVATGDLDIKVETNREDEIGTLVNSFNNMVKKLQDREENLKSAYHKSEEQRLYMENILGNINSGVIMLDTTGNISMINDAACSILNIKSEEFINKSYKGIVEKIRSEELQNLVTGIEGKEFRPVKKEVKEIIGDRKRILSVFITSLRDSQKYIGLLVVFDDLTEIIEAEKALTWQEMARKVAHEIKKTPTYISTIIDEVFNLYKGYKGVEINVSMPDNSPMVELDGEQFRRVMINIFDNAMQAVANNGRIDVTIKFDIPSNRAYIEIADNGPGIKDEDKDKLLLRYFSTSKDGTGLGLSIANRIIAEHRGYIRVSDK